MAAPLVRLDACEHEVFLIHELAVDQRFEEKLFDIRSDLAALLDPVFEEEAVDVGLLDPVGGLEVLLLAHEFGKFCLHVAFGLLNVSEDVGVL